MTDFKWYGNEEHKDYYFDNYDGSMVLKSNDKKTQDVYNKILSIFDDNHNNKLDANEIKSLWDNVVSADEDRDGTITEDEAKKALKNNPILSNLKISANELLKSIDSIYKTIDKSFEKTKANVHNKLMKDIQKKYPNDKYSVNIQYNDKDYSEITITSKNNNDYTIYKIFENGNYQIYTRIGDNEKAENYDKNGNMTSYSKLNNETHCWEEGHPLADAINGEITAKNKLGLPTTGKDLEKYIKQINPKNIIQIFDAYKDTYGETLLDAINEEWGLDNKIKERLLKHLNKCCIESDYWKYNKPNCKIDEDFYQGQIGDCWYLATISAIQRSPKGQEILNNMITDNKDGTYTVKFKGADKSYTVSALELMSKSKYAEGDFDVRILELAAKKHYFVRGINGGNPAKAYELLLGTGDKWKNIARNYSSKPSPQKIKELLNNKNIVMTATIHPFSKLWGMIAKSIPEDAEYKDDVATSHAYAVHDIDDKNIYLKNPWRTDQTIAIPLDIFEEYWGSVTYTEIE
ncbi:MAG: C2 family cysteine protease [bacterium]|nr:C2 family cysteine protease [bacterium]